MADGMTGDDIARALEATDRAFAAVRKQTARESAATLTIRRLYLYRPCL
jgi:hypothetical protein